MKISVLTATYNRANLLDKLYASILINSNHCSNCEVEWLVMDDGSTDNTRRVVEQYSKEGLINVQYFHQENKGKMSAINFLVKKATGDIMIECDSDDYFTKDAFVTIRDAINQCKETSEVYAFVFLKYTQLENNYNFDVVKPRLKFNQRTKSTPHKFQTCFPSQSLILSQQNSKGTLVNMGNEFPTNNYQSTLFDLYFKEGITGEKALAFNSKIRKQFEYELENNEKFVTEARLHHKMDLQYTVRCFNKPIMICEYQKEGYTKNINKLFTESPYGYYEYFKEMFDQDLHGVTLKKRLYMYKHYILFSILTKQQHPIKNVKGAGNKIMVAILYFPGKLATKIKMR